MRAHYDFSKAVKNPLRRRRLTLSAELEHVLNTATGEREVHAFLKKYPYLLIQTFNASWNYYLSVSEFPLGIDYRADFLLLSADSGRWHAVFIELESPHHRNYLRDGTPGKALRVAQKQVDDWHRMFQANNQYIRMELSKILAKCKAGVQSGYSIQNGHQHARTEILDPRTPLVERHDIIIGRRPKTMDDERNRQASPGWGYPDTVATYDRLLDAARNIETIAGDLKADPHDLARRQGCGSYELAMNGHPKTGRTGVRKA